MTFIVFCTPKNVILPKQIQSNIIKTILANRRDFFPNYSCEQTVSKCHMKDSWKKKGMYHIIGFFAQIEGAKTIFPWLGF